MEVGVGLKHHLCLVTEGVSDTDALSQCAYFANRCSSARGLLLPLFVSAGLTKAPVCSDVLVGLHVKLPSFSPHELR